LRERFGWKFEKNAGRAEMKEEILRHIKLSLTNVLFLALAALNLFAKGPEPVFKLLCKIENDQVTVISKKEVSMILCDSTQSRETSNRKNLVGYYYNLLDSKKITIDSISIANPYLVRAEYADPQEKRRIRGSSVKVNKAYFTIEIPISLSAHQVEFIYAHDGIRAMGALEDNKKILGTFKLK
jgi:hypothetical protein